MHKAKALVHKPTGKWLFFYVGLCGLKDSVREASMFDPNFSIDEITTQTIVCVEGPPDIQRDDVQVVDLSIRIDSELENN